MILPRPWNQTSERDASRHIATHSGFSRSLMRELILTGGLGPGSRVLIAGCGDGELAERLIPFGIQVTGIDEADDSIERAASLVPEAEFQAGPAPRSQFDRVTAQFDSAVVLASSRFRANIQQASPKQVTASLLHCLRPGGQFHFVATGAGGSLPHEPSCLARHLNSFPGEVSVSALADHRRAGSFMPRLVTFRVDGHPRSALEWDEFARGSADGEPCCRFCPIPTPKSNAAGPSSKAA
ncbi:MAG: class I SAM-dependent methyltransferase [Planctomycetes bacterium]|nr:class I SAM-dependent methyltransferase [Planctomycetota bacterium]